MTTIIARATPPTRANAPSHIAALRRPPPLRYYRVVRVRAGVIPQLESLLIQHVCPMLESCEGLYLGDVEHQMHVFNTFVTITRTMDISHGPGYVLRALLAGDKDLAYDMATSLDMYNTGLNLVHECIDRLDLLGDVMKPTKGGTL
jgi:hypothetical protein